MWSVPFRSPAKKSVGIFEFHSSVRFVLFDLVAQIIFSDEHKP